MIARVGVLVAMSAITTGRTVSCRSIARSISTITRFASLRRDHQCSHCAEREFAEHIERCYFEVVDDKISGR